MGCGSSSAKAADVEYVNGHPTFEGDEVVKCFEKDNGLLFRIVDNKKEEWAYYNDTTEYNMHVTVTFSPECEIEALGNTQFETLESGEIEAKIVVPPTATEMFIKGKVNGFQSKMDAVPLVNGEEHHDHHEGEGEAEAEAAPQE
eukprot:gene11742-biopygen8511